MAAYLPLDEGDTQLVEYSPTSQRLAALNGDTDLSLSSIATDSPSPNGSSPAPLLDKYGKPLLLHQASLLACTAAMTNTILGAGMLGLPHAMAEAGYFLGMLLLVLCGVAACFALHLLSQSAATVNKARAARGEPEIPSSFFVVASAAVPKATFLIDLAVVIKCFGVGTSFLIVIGDLVPEAIHTLIGPGHPGFLYDRRFWILVYMGGIVLPLACLRSLNSLRFTAMVSIGFVAFLVGVIVLYATVPALDECAGRVLDACAGDTRFAKLDVNTLKILSIFIFAFTCHQNIFSACNELSDFSMARMNKVAVGCIGTAWTLYACIALFAYHTYGAMINSNVLKNYPDNPTLAIARLLIATNCAFTFPLQCKPCRDSVSLLMHQFYYRNLPKEVVPAHVPSEFRISLLTSIICALALGVSMVVSDLGVVLSVVGATGSTTICYLLPGAIFLKLHPEWTTKHYFAAALFGAGCVIIPSCLTFIFL